MDKQPQSRAPLIVAIVLLLLPVLYVGSYLALVVPGGVVVPERAGVVRFMGHYRIAADSCKWVYLPLELMDRSVRPTAWKLAWEED